MQECFPVRQTRKKRKELKKKSHVRKTNKENLSKSINEVNRYGEK